LKLTGQDIHNAFCKVEPQARNWNDISLRAQQDYEAVAEELNRLLEQDTVTTDSVRCPKCGQMIESFTDHICIVEAVC
jgi:uncharacterized protein with PIN domain